MSSPLEKAIKIIIEVANPDKTILFGSRAKESYKEYSDYDICVIKKDVKHRRKLAQKLYKFLYGIGASVDIIVETPKRFEELKDNPFMIYREIAKYGRIVYEQ